MSFYEKLMCEFENYLISNNISTTAQILYHKLVYLSYKNNWKDFSISNTDLARLLGIKSLHTLLSCRDELIENNLIIKYIKDENKTFSKKNVTKYKILFDNFNNILFSNFNIKENKD